MNNYRYRLVSQSRNNQLVIEVIGERYRLLKDAKDVLSDETMMRGFSANDLKIINFIANDTLFEKAEAM